MSTTLIRAISVAALGAIAGAACMALAFVQRPAFILEMDHDLPRNVSGVFPPEFVPGGESFAWTGRSARINLPGLNRSVPWQCTVRLRGARSAPLTLPIVELGVDGAPAATRATTNAFEDMVAPIPPSPTRAGAMLTIGVSDTFVPGPGDARELGVQLDRVECRPEAGEVALPPRRAYLNGMLAGAIFGAAFGLIGITAGSAVGAVLLLALAQAFPLAGGPGPYVAYADRAPWLAFWIAGAMVAAIVAFDRWRRLRQTARFVIAFAAATLYLKLLALVHPATPLVDAVFQAHRLEWVLGGRYFFTQPMPGGVQFPYAIGLYVFAAPWAAIARDHVTLLRIVVCATECVAGGLLYPMIVRAWGDRLAGAIAAALFTTVPIAYVVVGNGNLTNAFGQAIGLIGIAVIVLLAPLRIGLPTIAAWTALIALGLLSHVSTLALLGATVATLAVLFWIAGATLRRAGSALAIALVLAATFAVGIYYRHFGDVFVDALRVRSAAAAVTTPAGEPAAPPRADTRRSAFPAPLSVRVGRGLRLVVDSIGWPILLLACVGAWRLASSRGRDSLRLALIAWMVTFVLFFAIGVARVGPEFERYSLEFVGRVAHATYPAAVIAAGFAAAAAWRARGPQRVAGLAFLALAMAIGVREWIQWR